MQLWMAGGFRVYGQENPKSPNEELNITNFGSLNLANNGGYLWETQLSMVQEAWKHHR